MNKNSDSFMEFPSSLAWLGPPLDLFYVYHMIEGMVLPSTSSVCAYHAVESIFRVKETTRVTGKP